MKPPTRVERVAAVVVAVSTGVGAVATVFDAFASGRKVCDGCFTLFDLRRNAYECTINNRENLAERCFFSYLCAIMCNSVFEFQDHQDRVVFFL